MTVRVRVLEAGVRNVVVLTLSRVPVRTEELFLPGDRVCVVRAVRHFPREARVRVSEDMFLDAEVFV